MHSSSAVAGARVICAGLAALVLALAACDPDDPPSGDDGGPLDGVKIDLLEAMAIADDTVPNAITLDAELSDEDGNGPIYDVDRYLDGETQEVVIDAATGDVIAIRFDPEDQADGPEQAAAIASIKQNGDGAAAATPTPAAADATSSAPPAYGAPAQPVVAPIQPEAPKP